MKDFTPLEKHILKYMMNDDITHYQDIGMDEMSCETEFKKYNELLDLHREESFVDTFPQFKDWYDSISC